MRSNGFSGCAINKSDEVKVVKMASQLVEFSFDAFQSSVLGVLQRSHLSPQSPRAQGVILLLGYHLGQQKIIALTTASSE